MKKICSIVLSLAILTTGVFIYASGAWKTISVLENGITVKVNGNVVEKENFLYNDTTYLPLRAVADAAGLEVSYDESTNVASIVNKSTIPLDQAKGAAYLMRLGKSYQLDAAYLITDLNVIIDLINMVSTPPKNKAELWSAYLNEVEERIAYHKENLGYAKDWYVDSEALGIDYSKLQEAMTKYEKAISYYEEARDYAIKYNNTNDKTYDGSAAGKYSDAYALALEMKALCRDYSNICMDYIQSR